jgi:hypothetical protein
MCRIALEGSSKYMYRLLGVAVSQSLRIYEMACSVLIHLSDSHLVNYLFRFRSWTTYCLSCLLTNLRPPAVKGKASAFCCSPIPRDTTSCCRPSPPRANKSTDGRALSLDRQLFARSHVYGLP